MRQLLNLCYGLVLITALALASCATHKQRPQLPAPEAQPTSGRAGEQPLESITVGRQPTTLDKLLHRTPEPFTVAVAPARIGKKSTVAYYYGPATVTNAGKKATVAAGDGAVASVVEKKAGPAIVASDSSTQNALLGGGNLAAVQGDGNTTSQTKQDTSKEAPGVLATIAAQLTGPLGIMLAIGAGIGCLYLVVLWRKKKAVENLV